MNRIAGIYICLLTLLFCFTACNKNKEVSVPSSDPTIKSLSFLAQDSFPGLQKAVFTVEDRLDTGLIYNADSILFGTSVTKVVPRFTYNHTPAAAIIYTPTDSFYLKGSDTIDFSAQPMYIKVVAEDLEHEKIYQIKVDVHKVDPDLFNWQLLVDNAFSNSFSFQKAFVIDNKFAVYLSDGLSVKLYTSDDAVSWSETATVGLPENTNVKCMISDSAKVYYADNTSLYISENFTDFTVVDISAQSFEMQSLLMNFNDSIWAVVLDNDVLSLATTTDGLDWNISEAPSADFPISDFANVSYLSSSLRRRASIIGGYSIDGKMLNSQWNVEYSPAKGYVWTNYALTNSFESLAAAAAVSYNKSIMLFGGIDNYNDILPDMLQSDNEGMSYVVPDSTHNYLPQTYRSRYNTNVIVDNDNYIYIIGGNSITEVYTDIYKGKLTSIDW